MMTVMNEANNGKSGRRRPPMAAWILLPGTLVALLLAIACWVAFLYLKPEWSTPFAGWWLGGIFLQRIVFMDGDGDLLSLTGAPALSLMLIATFFIVAVFFPGVLAIVSGLLIAAVLILSVLAYLRSML